MKVRIERANLLRALNHVHRVVERRNTAPILSNVLIRAEDDAVSLRATDLDVEMKETVPAVAEQSGGTTVPAHVLYDIVRKLPDGAEILMSTGSGAAMALEAGSAHFSIQTLPDTDFPDLAVGEMSNQFTLPAKDLRILIERTQFAISTEETRYNLNGIYLHAVQKDERSSLRAVATDGHRLARADVDLPEGARDMPGIIVPRKTVTEIGKLLEDPEAEVEIGVSATKIRIAIGRLILTSKLIDGTFPDYERVIPTGNDKQMRVDKATFEHAVDRVSTIAAQRGRAVKLSLTPGRLVLSVNNPDSGSATDEMAIAYEDSEINIGFNSRYLLDIAGQLQTEEALFVLADAGSPTLIHDSEGADALYVLMPMRV